MEQPKPPFDPYKPPFPASEAKTSEQRQEWLAWERSGREHRNKRSDEFAMTAALSMGTALLLVPVMLVVHDLWQYFTK